MASCFLFKKRPLITNFDRYIMTKSPRVPQRGEVGGYGNFWVKVGGGWGGSAVREVNKGFGQH